MNREDKFLFYQLNPLKRLKEEKPKDKGIKEKYIENLFCQNNSLIKEINAKNENYYPVINYKHKGKILSSVIVKISQINIYLNFKEANKIPGGLLEFLNRYQVEYNKQNHRRTGN